MIKKFNESLVGKTKHSYLCNRFSNEGRKIIDTKGKLKYYLDNK